MNDRLAPDRLSASDMSSLLAERGPIHVHVGGTVIVEGAAPPFEELIAHAERRLHLMPRFRQRITETPLNLSNPVWTDDARFDIRRHVRRVALPRPATTDELRDLVGRVMSEPLDMERPLWQIYLVEGLREGRHAIISKTHHALVDGISAVDVGMLLLDADPAGTQMEMPKKAWEPSQPTQATLFAQAAGARIRLPLRAAGRAARNTLTMPAKTAARVLRTAEAFGGLATGGPTCPRSSVNVRVGRDRRVAWSKTTLAKVKRARGRSEATVNDVILAAAAGALGRFMRARGDEVPDYLVALVPVSIRRKGEEEELGNRISSILAKLPVGEKDPARRLEIVREETARLKETDSARAASLIIEATGWAPPTINRLLSQAMSRPLIFNLVVSNVPGPQIPLYLMGKRLREIYPFVPLSPQMHALSIGVLSYNRKVFFGLAGDRDALSDLDDLADALDHAVEEQLAAAPPSRPVAPRAKASRAGAKASKPRTKTPRRPKSATARRPTRPRKTASRRGSSRRG
jgi:diacylglycerol O-acyltransferase